MKALNTTKNIKDMRLYSIDDSLNVFIVEKYPLSDNLHKLSHFNFDVPNYRLSKYIIDNVLKDNGYFYKLDIDDFSNIVLEYKPSSSSDRTTSKLFLIVVLNSGLNLILKIPFIQVDIQMKVKQL